MERSTLAEILRPAVVVSLLFMAAVRLVGIGLINRPERRRELDSLTSTTSASATEETMCRFPFKGVDDEDEDEEEEEEEEESMKKEEGRCSGKLLRLYLDQMKVGITASHSEALVHCGLLWSAGL
ncbi:MAG: hypothetical protein LQ347_003048 [Umbilicaria vellea]|nr:MAG: hypothetical protein LQ347_003048 [Umbilicaria vellea]